MTKITGWVGVDLDGTLAEYHGWKGWEHIGPPVPSIVAHVVQLLQRGVEVRIFTARAVRGQKAVNAIESWCLTHLGTRLQVTNIKDMEMIYLLDDRAVSVETNTGRMAVVPPVIRGLDMEKTDDRI